MALCVLRKFVIDPYLKVLTEQCSNLFCATAKVFYKVYFLPLNFESINSYSTRE